MTDMTETTVGLDQQYRRIRLLAASGGALSEAIVLSEMITVIDL